jgi:predicted ATPase
MSTIVPADPDPFFVITGGPGAGKTALLEALRADGSAVAPESARAILRERSAPDQPPAPADLRAALRTIDRHVNGYIDDARQS